MLFFIDLILSFAKHPQNFINRLIEQLASNHNLFLQMGNNITISNPSSPPPLPKKIII